MLSDDGFLARILWSALKKNKETFGSQFGDIKSGEETLRGYASQANEALLRLGQEGAFR